MRFKTVVDGFRLVIFWFNDAKPAAIEFKNSELVINNFWITVSSIEINAADNPEKISETDFMKFANKVFEKEYSCFIGLKTEWIEDILIS